jgi:DNA invertase Pin-like site-specific DNA recombinase
MALVGLVRVSTTKQETQRQHDDLGPICVKVFEEKISGKLKVADRPDLRAALDHSAPATCSPSRKPTGSAATSSKD